MKNKSFYTILILIFALFTLSLSACQLAQETGASLKVSDELCGVFVTMGHPDYDNIPSVDLDINYNGKTGEPKDLLSLNYDYKFEGKLTDDESSLEFDGLDGYFFGLIKETDDKGNDSSGAMGSLGLHHVSYSTNITDENTSNLAEATLYVNTGFHEVIFLNPVYLRQDGSYYTMLHQNPGFSISGVMAGSSSSSTLSNTLSSTMAGITKSDTISFKINVMVLDKTQEMLIKEMSANDKLIKSTRYQSNAPDTFVLDSNTDYVIVEEILINESKEKYIKRQLYDINREDTENNHTFHVCFLSDDNELLGASKITFVYE